MFSAAIQEDTEELNQQYALRLQEFQDARKEMAKIAAKKNVPWRQMAPQMKRNIGSENGGFPK